MGLYLPPVLKYGGGMPKALPPQTIISSPVHTAVCTTRGTGALTVVVATQASVFGLYRPPLLSKVEGGIKPPQTIISSPVQTPVKSTRPSGAFIVLVAVQLFVPGLYLPPVFKAPF